MVWVLRDLKDHLNSNTLPQARTPPDQYAQNDAQTGLEHLQILSIHSLAGQNTLTTLSDTIKVCLHSSPLVIVSFPS